MAQARGICPVCGEERAVRGGSMREHNDPRTKRTHHGVAISDFCQGSYRSPSRLTKTEEEATAEQEAKKTERVQKEKEKINKRAAPFKDLTDEVKEAFSKAVMDWDEPDICEDGRRKFLKAYGFPTPPRQVIVPLYITVEAKDNEIGPYREPTQALKDRMTKVIKENVPEAVKVASRTY